MPDDMFGEYVVRENTQEAYTAIVECTVWRLQQKGACIAGKSTVSNLLP